MSLRRNILSNAGATAIGSLIQLILVLLLARWLDVGEFAVFITATAVVGFGEMASDFGVRIWGTRQFSVKDSVSGILGPALLSKTSTSLLLILIILLLPFQLLTTKQALLAGIIACTQPSTDPLLWFMRGKERLDIEAVITLGWRTANALVLGATAWFDFGVTSLLAAWLACNLVRVAIEWRVPLLGQLRLSPLFEGQHVRAQVVGVLRQSFPIGIAFLVMAIYQRLGILMLGEIAPPETVSHFGAAFTLVASAGFVATSITVSSFPRLARAAEAGDWADVCAITNNKLKMVMAVFLPACLLGMFAAPWIVHLLYPAAYQDAAIAIVALLPGLYISSVNFALKYLMNTLHNNWMDVISVLSGITVFVLILLLAGGDVLLLVAGAAWGIGEAVIFVVKWRVLRHNKKTRSIELRLHLISYLFLLVVMLKVLGGMSD